MLTYICRNHIRLLNTTLVSLLTTSTIFITNVVNATPYPERPVSIVVPQSAGGGTDILARLLASGLPKEIGQPVVVDNRPGASGIIGSNFVAHNAPANGYTTLLGALGSLVLTPNSYSTAPYDSRQDFEAVSLVGRFAFALVVNPEKFPVSTMEEFISETRNNETHYASPGAGTPHHLAIALLAKNAGLKLNPVPYKSGGDALPDLISGRVPVMLLDIATAMPHIKSGSLRALAVTSETRVASLPDIPTAIESGIPDLTTYAWQGIVVRKGTSKSVIDALSEAVKQTLEKPEIREKMLGNNIEPVHSSPEDFSNLISAEYEKWSEIIHANGVSNK